MFNLIASILAWFYSITHSYGAAIVLLTLVVMAVTTPFTLKGTKSMLQMQRLQPQLKAIQAKHKGDREKMNVEMMAFYKANNINPIGGCLPLIIQIPVFLVLFRVLSGLTRRITNFGVQAGLTAISVPAAVAFAVAPDPKRNFDPGYISDSSELYQSLAQTNTMKSWGLDMSESASQALGVSIGHAIPYLLLILVVLVTSVYQQRQISGRNPGAMGNPQQQAIMKIMPYFLPVFSFAMPAGLVVYFFVSNLWRVGQNAFITRTLYGAEDSLGRQAIAARDEVVDVDATEVTSEDATEKKKGTRSAGRSNGSSGSTRSPMGRARVDGDGDGDGRASGRGRGRGRDKVGGRLRELDNGRGKGKKGTGDGPSSTYTSGRVTPKGDAARTKKRKTK